MMTELKQVEQGLVDLGQTLRAITAQVDALVEKTRTAIAAIPADMTPVATLSAEMETVKGRLAALEQPGGGGG